MTMDDIDARILEVAQSEFPVESRPFEALAARIGITEDEALERIRRLQETDVIREIGPVFNLRKLGYTSTLCAAQVAESCVERVAAFVNGFAEVTHNYLRDDPFNMWFTLIAPSEIRLNRILDLIRREPGVAEVISLPGERMFKINVHFNTAKADE